MNALKVPLLTFTNRLMCWIGHALLVQPSISVHRNGCMYQLLPIKYELKLPSEVTPGLLPFRSRSKHCVGGVRGSILYYTKHPWFCESRSASCKTCKFKMSKKTFLDFAMSKLQKWKGFAQSLGPCMTIGHLLLCIV